MKYTLAFLAAILPAITNAYESLDSASIPLKDSVINSAAYAPFRGSDVRVLNLVSRRDQEPDPNRKNTLQDGLVFVVQCTDPGFRGNCLVFGAAPGQCVTYSDFESHNETMIEDTYNNAVSSLSTNTGGVCQFYKYIGCDNKGDDRGLTSSYNYDLSVALPSDPRTVEYENAITSWRC